MDRKEAVGMSIKIARTKANMTQEQLAERADISSSYVSVIERGKQSVSLEYMDRIADALNTTVSELLKTGETEKYAVTQDKPSTVREKNKYEGNYIERKRKMNHINEMLSSCSDEEFQIAYDEILLLMNKFQYLSDKGRK